MENNQNNGIPIDHAQFSNALQNIWRGIFSANTNTNNNHPSPQEENFDDLPPLEPINANQNVSDPPPEPIHTLVEHSDGSEDIVMSSSNPGPVHVAQTSRDDDEDSMPSLHSVSSSGSDSDSDSDVAEVEMMQDLQPVDDDNDSFWEDIHDDPPLGNLPSLEPISRHNRRARVEDDHDDERDRRHPSQRTSSSEGSQSTLNMAQPGTSRNGPDLAPFRIPQHFFQTPPPNANTPTGDGNSSNANPPQNSNANSPQLPDMMATGFAFVMDANGNTVGPPRPIPIPAEILERVGPIPHLRPPERPPLNTGDFRVIADFFERFGVGIHAQEEQEDPERAKKLLAGLEEVPNGLVRRMERVGGAPGAHVDDATGQVEAPGCAICWDSLLDAEGEGFKPEEQAAEEPIGSEAPGPSSDPRLAPTSSKIISLPCAHVFHEGCLIPWFSRPRQTTCPTCRFNIDPENLTHVFRARPREAPAGGQNATSTPNNSDPNTTPAGPAPIPSEPVNATDGTPVQPIPAPIQLNAEDINRFPPNPFLDALRSFNGAQPWPPGAQPVPAPAGDERNPTDNHEQPPPNARGGAFLSFDLSISIEGAFFPEINQANPEGPPIPPPFDGAQFHFHPGRPSRRPRKEWTPPPPPGPTLRQRVEEKEREAGLRCFDVSCGVGPSDEDPFPTILVSLMKQLSIGPLSGSAVVGTSVCSHTFHPGCLVSAERVAGWGGEDKTEGVDEVEVCCPVCRAIGSVTKEEWKEGVTALV